MVLGQNSASLSKLEGGRSSSFIFTTPNEKFVIKTIPGSERNILIQILERYMQRIVNTPESRLVRIIGLFKILPQNIDFIIMENIIPFKEHAIIFDLKGSLSDRLVGNVSGLPKGVVMKDQNFMDSSLKVTVEQSQVNRVIEIMKDDFDFLRIEYIMDYSILVAFYRQRVRLENRFFLWNEGETYAIGIIDILQEYNFTKISEERLKKIYKKNRSMISVAEPNVYCSRITEFLERIFI
jgi:hypothetical protein